jgi:hypothetical protein
MRGRLTLLLAAALIAGACGSDSPTDPTPGPSRLAIVPQADFLAVGVSIVLEARLTDGTAPPRVVTAEWSSSDGRVAAVDRSGRVTGLAPGTTTIRAVAGSDTATLSLRAVPDYAGTWTGSRRVTACNHPRPEFCPAAYPVNAVVPMTLTLTQSNDRTSGTLRLSPPLASPSSAVTGTITEQGRLTLEGTIVSTPATGASTTLGTLANFSTDIEPATKILRGSFSEQRVDADGTRWTVSWDLQGMTKLP